MYRQFMATMAPWKLPSQHRLLRNYPTLRGAHVLNLDLLLSYSRYKKCDISFIIGYFKLYMVKHYEVLLTRNTSLDFAPRNGRLMRANLRRLSYGEMTFLVKEKCLKCTMLTECRLL